MHIFISYGRADKDAFAKKLAAWLREQGHEPWLDVEQGIPPGHPFDVRIEQGIHENEILLAVLSPWSVRPESFCRNEILYAQTLKKTVLPVRMADVIPPIQIISLNYVDACARPDDVFSLLDNALEIIRATGAWQPYSLPAGKPWYESGDELDFQEELVRFGTGFVGREWLFEELRAWARDPESRVCLLVADVGIGKSAIAARLTTVLDVKGVHFCTRSLDGSCKPVPWIRALIRQLARQLPAYREILDTVPEPNWDQPPVSLFRTQVRDRLAACMERLQIEEPWVFVIDALDEADPAMVEFLTDLTDIHSEHTERIDRIPPWIRLILTSRPDAGILKQFNADIKRECIRGGDLQQRSDVDSYLEKQYQVLVAAKILPERSDLPKQFKNLANGNFHYATVLMDALKHPDLKQRLQVDEIGTLPKSLSGLYNRLFRRRFGNVDRDNEAKRCYKNNVRPLLDCLTAASDPVPESLLVAAAGRKDEEVAIEGLGILSQFLIHEHDTYRFFHESVREWLTKNRVGNPFAAYPSKGHRYLADAGSREVNGSDEKPSDYTLRWLPEHLISIGKTEELARLMAEPRFFVPLWRMSNNVAGSTWVQVEGRTSLRMVEVYSPIIQNPNRYPDELIEIVAKLFYRTGHPRDALSLFEFQSRIASEKGDRESLQRSLINRAVILRVRGDLDGAMALHEEESRICRELGNDDGLQRSLGNQAMILKARGDLDGAMRLQKEKERICREIKNVDSLQKTLGNQAMILRARGDLDVAMKLIEEQEEICRSLGNVDSLQHSLGNRAVILQTIGDLDGAMALHIERERYCREIGNVNSLQASLGDQATILYGRGELDNAMMLYKEQTRICRELGNVESLARSLRNQAGVLAKQNRNVEATRAIDEALALSTTAGYAALAKQIRGIKEQLGL